MKTQKLGSRIFRSIKDIRIAVLILGTAILFYACSNNEIDKIQVFSSPEDLPTLEVNNFESLITDSGIIRHSLKAPVLLEFENKGKRFYEFPKGIEIIKYNANKTVISSIKAEYAKQFLKEGKWEAKNNVVVTNAKGDSLKTEHLIWEEKAEKIYTEEFVKIISKDKIITGIGLTSDQNMTNTVVKKPQGIIYVTVDEQNRKQKTKNKKVIPAETGQKKPPKPKVVKFK